MPRAAEERSDRRLFRNEGGRSVSRARKRGRGSDQEMDRSGKQTHLRLPRDDPGAEEDQGQDDGPLELREVHGALPRRRQLFLFQEHWPAKPERCLYKRQPAGRWKSLDRSEYVLKERRDVRCAM